MLSGTLPYLDAESRCMVIPYRGLNEEKAMGVDEDGNVGFD